MIFNWSLSSLSDIETAAELPAGGAEEEGESLGLHTQPAAATDRLPRPGEQFSPGRGIKFSIFQNILPIKGSKIESIRPHLE